MKLPTTAGVQDTMANSHAAVDCVAITPADADIDLVDLGAADAPRTIRGFSFGSAGTIRITTLGGNIVDYESGDLVAGIMHPIGVKRIHSSGTTALRFKVYW